MAGGKSSSPWMKKGKQGSDPVAPGSYGGWYKLRNPPGKYKTLSQQKNVGEAGRKMTVCKGKKGGDFRKCRHDVMKEVFGI